MKKLTFVFGVLLVAMFVSCSSPVSTSNEEDERTSTPAQQDNGENSGNGSSEQTPPQPTEDLAVAANNEYGIAYIYLPESDEANTAKSLNANGLPITSSNAQYRLEVVKTVTKKSSVTDTISTRAEFITNGDICNNLKVYKVFVSRNVTETEFYISSAAYTSKVTTNRIFYKLVKSNGNWYMSTKIFDYGSNPTTFVDGSVPQFTDDYEDAAN